MCWKNPPKFFSSDLHQQYPFLRIIHGLPINIENNVSVDVHLCHIWLGVLFSKKFSISFLPFHIRFSRLLCGQPVYLQCHLDLLGPSSIGKLCQQRACTKKRCSECFIGENPQKVFSLMFSSSYLFENWSFTSSQPTLLKFFVSFLHFAPHTTLLTTGSKPAFVFLFYPLSCPSVIFPIIAQLEVKPNHKQEGKLAKGHSLFKNGAPFVQLSASAQKVTFSNKQLATWLLQWFHHK